jgi:hypothetical protein
MHLVIAILLLSLSSLYSKPIFENTIHGEKELEQDELVLVHTVWRHGSRAPLVRFFE